MERLRRFYNQNRRAIFYFIGIMFVGYMLLQVANNYYEQKEEKESKQANSITKDASSKFNTTASDSSKDENKTSIEVFIQYCQDEEYYKNAYEMLDEETKRDMQYSNYETFITNFIKEFIQSADKNKTKKIKTDIYELDVYSSDMLQTGNINSSKIKYIKLVDGKIKIQDFIQEKEVNKKYIKEDICITVKKIKYFKEYVELEVFFMNNASEDINIRGSYLKAKKAEYSSNNNESINLKPFESKTINLKYKVKYGQDINQIIFEKSEETIEIGL